MSTFVTDITFLGYEESFLFFDIIQFPVTFYSCRQGSLMILNLYRPYFRIVFHALAQGHRELVW